MAMTATISTNPASTAVTGQRVTASLVISNSGTVPVKVLTVDGLVKLTSSAVSNYGSGISIGKVNTGPNTNLTVAPSGTLTLSFEIIFHAPSTGVLSDGAGTFDIGALVRSDDGSEFGPTASTLTVNYVITYPASQQ